VHRRHTAALAPLKVATASGGIGPIYRKSPFRKCRDQVTLECVREFATTHTKSSQTRLSSSVLHVSVRVFFM